MSELDAYDYDLPPELIAQHPPRHRVDARLMVLDRRRGTMTHSHFRDLREWLRRGDCLVLNDTRVIPARLVGYRTSTGGYWEGLYITHDTRGIWKVLAHTRGKPEPGETITLRDRFGDESVSLLLLDKLEGGMWAVRPKVSLPTEPTPIDPLELLDRVGSIPLPPYIRGGVSLPSDREDYQTVFARDPGSVAAPTAGLHFTQRLLAELTELGVTITYVTLHVGVGTFRPIQVERLADHVMHQEWCRVTSSVVERCRATRAAGGRVIAVGTTALRTLETAALGGELQPWDGETSLFIRPPFTFQAIDGLITNFHLPRSSLLVLVRTFGGDELLRRAYNEAIQERYRFFSYGDGMLIV